MSVAWQACDRVGPRGRGQLRLRCWLQERGSSELERRKKRVTNKPTTFALQLLLETRRAWGKSTLPEGLSPPSNPQTSAALLLLFCEALRPLGIRALR